MVGNLQSFVETFFDAFAVADGGGFERPEEVRAVRRRGALIGSAKQTVRERRAMVDERVAIFFLQMNLLTFQILLVAIHLKKLYALCV